MRLDCLFGVLLGVLLCSATAAGDPGAADEPAIIFSAADQDGNLCLSMPELSNALRMIGFPKIPRYGVRLFYVVLDYEVDGCLSPEEWMSLFIMAGLPEPESCPESSTIPIFAEADRNQDDCLNLKELRTALARMGFGNLPPWIVRVFWALLNRRHDDCIDTCEFMFFTLMPPPPPPGTPVDDPIFNGADTDSDGCLDIHELRQAIRQLFGNMPQMVVRVFHVALDKNRDTCLNEAEWSILTDGM